jgi:hypothetical protein
MEEIKLIEICDKQIDRLYKTFFLNQHQNGFRYCFIFGYDQSSFYEDAGLII